MMALAHEEPDRVPFDYWAEKKVTTRLMQELNLAEYERLLEHLQIDMRYKEGTRYVGPELQKMARRHMGGYLGHHSQTCIRR
jgi:uroporphyrinogen decarboxylase